MALNGDRVGHSYPSYRYEVAREKIREYARAVGETDPRYFSDGDDCVAPPTFVACFTLTQPSRIMAEDPDLGFHSRLVHGSQAYTFGDRPLRPGDVLTCTPTIASIRSRGGSDFLTVEVDCRHVDGSLAVATEILLVLFDDPEGDDSGDGAGGGGADDATAGDA